jgi:hypothetical protein
MTVVRRAVLRAEDVITRTIWCWGEAAVTPAGPEPEAEESKWDGLPLKEAVRRSISQVERAA